MLTPYLLSVVGRDSPTLPVSIRLASPLFGATPPGNFKSCAAQDEDRQTKLRGPRDLNHSSSRMTRRVALPLLHAEKSGMESYSGASRTMREYKGVISGGLLMPACLQPTQTIPLKRFLESVRFRRTERPPLEYPDATPLCKPDDMIVLTRPSRPRYIWGGLNAFPCSSHRPPSHLPQEPKACT